MNLNQNVNISSRLQYKILDFCHISYLFYASYGVKTNVASTISTSGFLNLL